MLKSGLIRVFDCIHRWIQDCDGQKDQGMMTGKKCGELERALAKYIEGASAVQLQALHQCKHAMQSGLQRYQEASQHSDPSVDIVYFSWSLAFM